MANNPVMPGGEGHDLNRVVKVLGPLPVDQAIDYLIQAAHVLDAAHGLGIVHGDIRPGTLVVDRAGIVHVAHLGSPDVKDDRQGANKSASGYSTHNDINIAAVDYLAPERAETAYSLDPRADIYSLGCTLYFLLTGHTPFAGETPENTLKSHREEHAPSLRTSRPDVSMKIEAGYETMVAKCPDDRPRSMAEVIAILEDLVTGATTESRRAAPNPEATSGARLRRSPQLTFRARSRQRAIALSALACGLLVAILVAFAVSRRPRVASDIESSAPALSPGSNEKGRPVDQTPPAQPVMIRESIFDGQSARGWMLCNRTPLPARNVQRDGLNPHRSGSYLVVYEHKLGDFVLEFDYKLSRGCNSGVFFRVSDLNDPVQTGIEVSLDDTRHGDDRDSGGLLGLAAPSEYAQKPAGEWNHMTITTSGPRIHVVLNEIDVVSIDLDSRTLAPQGLDSSDHRIPSRAIAHMSRIGYVGFQDLGGDCWFRNIDVTTSSR